MNMLIENGKWCLNGKTYAKLDFVERIIFNAYFAKMKALSEIKNKTK